MSDWKTLSSEEVYKTPWIRVRRDEVVTHNGKRLTYSVVELSHPSVFILAVNPKGQIYMLQNYRYTVDKTMWEMPAGHSDDDDFLASAKRELLEEASLESDDWTNLGTLYQANGTGSFPFIAFLARDVRKVKNNHEEDEQITNGRFFEVAEVEKMAKDGEFIESAHLALLYLAKLHGL